VDARTDIYALGATFYNLLCGAKPFDDPDVMAIIEKHQREPVPDVRARAPAVSRTAADAICKAMAKDLKDRFQTCEEFARALSAGEGGGDESGTGERGEEFWNSFAKMLRGVRKDKP
jgi:serine/threonine protein kinase